MSHLDKFSSQAGKGTKHQEERGCGPPGAASPRGCAETDGRFGSSVVMEGPASSSHCKASAQHCPGWQVWGRLHPFKHAISNRQHQRCFIGKSALEKSYLGSGRNGKKIRMASVREAEKLSLVSLHKLAFPAHGAM